MNQQILIVEDEQELADILAAYLRVEGYDARVAKDGKEGMELFQNISFDLILLDIMLPKKDGIQMCKEIRETSDTPIMMISAKSGEMDKVVALGIGADDYVTKPFSPLELIARVKALLRRYEKHSKIESEHYKKELVQGKLVLNKSAYTVKVQEELVTFTTKEFDVLYYLAENPDQVFTKEQIYQNVWGYEGICDDNSVTVYINRIREKLMKQEVSCIHTVWGAGYKFSMQ